MANKTLLASLKGLLSRGDMEQEDCRGSANPLLRIKRAAQDALAAAEQQFAASRRLDEVLREIEEQASRAWRERERLIQDYYGVLRGVLQILDDCLALSADQPGLETVRAGLERILREQAVEPLAIATGDRFQADSQCCEQTVSCDSAAPGTVLRVLAPGYCRRLADGTAVVIRPARVVVSEGQVNVQESQS